MKVSSYLKDICGNDENIYQMTQESSWIQKNHSLEKSSYYKDHLNLVELGNTKFSSKISQMINNLMHAHLKLKNDTSFSL